MGMWSRFTNFLRVDGDDEFEDGSIEDAPRKNVVQFSDRDKGGGRCRGVSIFHPRRYEEVTEIADNLRAARHIVVNLVGADRALTQRVVDFLSGVVYTVDGKMQRLGEGIYLFVPANVPVTARDGDVATAVGYEGY